MRAYEKQEKQQLTQKPQSAVSGAGPVHRGIPNSAMQAMHGMPEQFGRTSDLGQQIQSRLFSAGERPQAQIPQAENEADRLSASVRGGSPEGVKSMMGQRMGADFSGVRFHTGAEAAARADAMGARAYTSGADVYFGAGGFDAAVAAHELVHTVQQGVVDSGVSTMATPVGGVQMWPWDKNKAKGAAQTAAAPATNAPVQPPAAATATNDPAAMRGLAATGAAAAAPAEQKENILKRAWNKTGQKAWDGSGGRAIRKHHDALDELYHARQGTDNAWKDLSWTDRLAWRAKNPLAYAHYKLSSESSLQKDVDARSEKRQEERAKARQYLDELARDGNGAGLSMLNKEANGQFSVGLNTRDVPAAQLKKWTVGRVARGAWRGMSGLADFTDNGAVPADIASGARDVNWANNLGAFVGGLNVFTGAVGAANDVKELVENAKESTKMEKLDAGVSAAGNIAKVASGGLSIAGAAGAVPIVGTLGGAATSVSGAADVYKGLRNVYQGGVQKYNMHEFNKGYAGQDRKRMAQDDLLMMDSASLGGMEATRQIGEGIGQTITGAVDVATGIAQASGVGAPVAAATGAFNTLVKGGFAAANHKQRSRMQNKVVEQTTGLTDEQILAFQRANKIKNFSRAKQALMKELGYESGTRAELFADQTELRGEYLAGKANDANPGNDRARQLVQGLGVHKRGGNYRGEEVAKRMGLGKTREELLGNVNRLQKLAPLRREQRAQEALKQQEKDRKKKEKEEARNAKRKAKNQQSAPAAPATR